MAVVEAATGGSATAVNPNPIGRYRKGYELEILLANAGIPLTIGMQSRVPAVRDALKTANEEANGLDLLRGVMEQIVDSNDYPSEPERAAAVADYLNHRLQRDGYQLRRVGQQYRLMPLATNAQVASALSETARVLNLDSVTRDFERALAQANRDPEDAITSACSTVESVCKCLLDHMGLLYPANQDISGLVREVQKRLDLAPDRDDLTPDLKRILGGLSNIATGIGLVDGRLRKVLDSMECAAIEPLSDGQDRRVAARHAP